MESLPVNIEKIRDIFYDYYGEERTDIVQRTVDWYDVIVWFPSVIVSNENRRSTVVRDLFVKTGVYASGKLKSMPTMAKSTFTEAEAISGYVHSHCSGWFPSRPNDYNSLCFGTGPLVSTCSSLLSSFNEQIWILFCGELDLYVQTESIAGIPYKRLETIGATRELSKVVSCSPKKLNPVSQGFSNFIVHLFTKCDIPIVYNNGIYNIAMDNNDFILFISEEAEKFVEENGYVPELTFSTVKVKNGKFYSSATGVESRYRDVDYSVYITFKGENRPLRVLHNNNSANENTVNILNNKAIELVASVIYKTINIDYVRKRKEQHSACAR